MITARTPKEREGERGAFDKGKWMAREKAAARRRERGGSLSIGSISQ